MQKEVIRLVKLIYTMFICWVHKNIQSKIWYFVNQLIILYITFWILDFSFLACLLFGSSVKTLS